MDTKLWIDESDNYTKRQIENLNGEENLYDRDGKKEFAKELLSLTSKYIDEPKNILEVGCAFGANMFTFRDVFKNANLYGIDPGKYSNALAKKNLEGKKDTFITNGFSHELPYEDNMFDLIIFQNVFQWIPQKYLARTISEVDRVLKTNGLIYIQDFLANKPVTSKSRHDDEIYIFKDDYVSFFTAYPWYKEVYKELSQIENGEDQQRHISLVRKYPIEEVYALKKGAVEKNLNK